MDARSAVQWIILIFVVLVGFCFPAFSDSVRICNSQTGLRIPAQPDSSKSWTADTLTETPGHFTIRYFNVTTDLAHTKVLDMQIFWKGGDSKKET